MEQLRPKYYTYTTDDASAPWLAVTITFLPGPVVKGARTADRHYPVVFHADTPEQALASAHTHWAEEARKAEAKVERGRALAASRLARAALAKALPPNPAEDAA